MKKILGTTVALAVLAIFVSSAQTVIKIETATVQTAWPISRATAHS